MNEIVKNAFESAINQVKEAHKFLDFYGFDIEAGFLMSMLKGLAFAYKFRDEHSEWPDEPKEVL